MKRKLWGYVLLAIFLLPSCMPTPVPQDPNLIFTIVASTQTAAALQTQMAQSAYSPTPTQQFLRPTFTLFPTMTPFVYNLTSSPTSTYTPSPTRTPGILDGWPDWTTGENVVMPKGSGENIGVNRRFGLLVGVQVLVSRSRGVKLRAVPNKAQDGPLEERGSALTLTGIMNRNKQYGWFFAQVEADNGKTYWIGGDYGGETGPRQSLTFYYPFLTASATPTITETPNATLTITFLPPTSDVTPTPTNTPFFLHTATPLP